jgi:hypothetical protein
MKGESSMSVVSRARTRNGSVAASATARHLSIQVGQLNFLAQWEIDVAPRTCELFGRLLPLRMKVIHCAWSGEGVWVPLGKWEASWYKENESSLPKPGQLLLHPGGPSEPELLIPCGVCVFNSKFGILKGNHFATISDGIDGLGELHRLLLWQGAQDCIIEEIYPA